MDDQAFSLLIYRLDQQDKMLVEIRDNLKQHTEKDEKYWRKIDVQEGQITLLKALGAGVVMLWGYVEWWLFRR